VDSSGRPHGFKKRDAGWQLAAGRVRPRQANEESERWFLRKTTKNGLELVEGKRPFDETWHNTHENHSKKIRRRENFPKAEPVGSYMAVAAGKDSGRGNTSDDVTSSTIGALEGAAKGDMTLGCLSRPKRTDWAY